jgi:hypothetical protein
MTGWWLLVWEIGGMSIGGVLAQLLIRHRRNRENQERVRDTLPDAEGENNG